MAFAGNERTWNIDIKHGAKKTWKGIASQFDSSCWCPYQQQIFCKGSVLEENSHLLDVVKHTGNWISTVWVVIHGGFLITNNALEDDPNFDGQLQKR
jgi:hypothetical protein